MADVRYANDHIVVADLMIFSTPSSTKVCSQVQNGNAFNYILMDWRIHPGWMPVGFRGQ